MVVSKAKDSGDQPQPPRSDGEVKRLRNAVLFAWEHLHTVVNNNGASGSVAPPRLQQETAPKPAGSSPKYDETRSHPTSLNNRQCTMSRL
ncbi:hypothetical protein ACOSQ3_013405 [Xanthoceras sorbifolium]